MAWSFAFRRIVPAALILALLCTTATLLGAQRFRTPRSSRTETIFVTIGSYRDVECAATLLSLYRQARRPELVFAGVVTYTAAPKPGIETAAVAAAAGDIANVGETATAHPEAGDGVDGGEGSSRLSLDLSSAKGPSVSRHQAATMYGGEQYLLQHYPPSWDDVSERRVPVMCRAQWAAEAEGQYVITLEAELVEPPPREGEFRPVPFAAAGFMFTEARVLHAVPFDPTLEYLFHGEEALYSARLWTHGWDMFAPDRNVAFHHYGREGAPKFWNVAALMLSEHGTGFKYGMGTQRTVRQWWQYSGLDPTNRSQVLDGRKFCRVAAARQPLHPLQGSSCPHHKIALDVPEWL
ncbi:hypothetical protein VOLCADRAFT_93546 [Volvox carteri f. nagariensis]|uniref:Uncharacterized protein n=1 Tax=Volvox carteri f. nagariensis TaxID=3068 RepID=D8U2E5_VOLCA|nr:uncharacterized protein VOLCADRAFT_93546 [Volvox carteri f. nagariensis]EFJ46119.1 hypothetical protein VOLCADRAFT_93546 [Volvox carteri f. nagariensis]|eukprot:XP_002952869.1 hypothetical protein VOLCADRAFT_93546 [Volvox carteri f. nagariensis]